MLGGPFSPIFDDFDDGGFFGRPYRRSDDKRRQLQQIQRQREEEARIEKLAHEENIRRQREAERLEKLSRQRRQGQRQYPSYKFVRSPDGCLYRVPVNQEGDVRRQTSPPPKLARKSEQSTIVRGPDGRLYLTPQSDVDDFSTSTSTSTSSVAKMDEDYSEDESKGHDAMSGSAVPPGSLNTSMPIDFKSRSHNRRVTSNGDKTSNTRRKVTAIVEDVPESEYEDEELKSIKSVFRNRRPGPGDSWMQPIKL